MHALLQPVPEFLCKYGNIAIFNQQGLEKLNQIQTVDFFRSTNYRGVEALNMLLQKSNRLHDLEDNGFRRIKITHKCSNCSVTGHNLKTCTNPCTTCGFPTFYSPSHIKKLTRGGQKHAKVTDNRRSLNVQQLTGLFFIGTRSQECKAKYFEECNNK